MCFQFGVRGHPAGPTLTLAGSRLVWCPAPRVLARPPARDDSTSHFLSDWAEPSIQNTRQSFTVGQRRADPLISPGEVND